MTVDGIAIPFDCETLRFHLRVRSLTVLPPYKGAVFHGAFDNAFRRLVCPLPRRACDACTLKTKCHYITLCRPAPPEGFKDGAKFSNAPPPYVLSPPADNRRSYKPGRDLTFEITLIGRALDTLPYTIFTFVQIGRRGLGREHGRYDIEHVDLLRDGQTMTLYDGTGQTLRPIPPAPRASLATPREPIDQITLALNTPLRLKQKGRLVTQLGFPFFFEALARRLTLLSGLYGNNGCPPDFDRLNQQAATVKTIHDKTFWYDWPRYSTRQQALMKFGGLRGEITFQGDLAGFVPWLRLGEIVHVGQGSGFGLGGYGLKIEQPKKGIDERT